METDSAQAVGNTKIGSGIASGRSGCRTDMVGKFTLH